MPTRRRSRRWSTPRARGRASGRPPSGRSQLAEEIVAAVPSVEMVRLVSSGTEAAMTTLRLARAATEREPFVRFRGNYHGHADPFLSEAGSGVRTLGLEAGGEGRVVDYNDLEAVEGCDRGGGVRLRRARGREHGRGPAGGRVPRRVAAALRRERRLARLRRGDHGFPRRPRRRAGALWRAARPDRARQDRRRRPAARGLRRASRADGAPRARPATSTRRERFPATRSRPRRACPC